MSTGARWPQPNRPPEWGADLLVGTADVEQLAAGAPEIHAWPTKSVELSDATCLQVIFEMPNRAREACLPPALHPTVPAVYSLRFWHVGASPWGPFTAAVGRVGCRSGIRARGFTTAAFVSSTEARDGLAGSFGYPAVAADVELRVGYDGVTAVVRTEGEVAVSVAALDPTPMGLGDVQYTSTLNLAHTPLGLQLVQVEPKVSPDRAERLAVRVSSFDGSLWNDDALAVGHVVSGSLTHSDTVVPPPRFVCSPTELAFTGTRPVTA